MSSAETALIHPANGSEGFAGMDRVRRSTESRNAIGYTGPLDFAFIVHGRNVEDIERTYPHLRDVEEAQVIAEFGRHDIHIGAPITVALPRRTLHGELIGVPFMAGRTRKQLKALRSALATVCQYCEWRETRIVGLGALLPSLTDFGTALLPHVSNVGLTTGHSFTAHAIAEHVRSIEALTGNHCLGIVGAAGSTGRATLEALQLDSKSRKILLVDLPQKLSLLAGMMAPESAEITISADLKDLRACSLVICVTNAPTAMIRSEHLAPGAIVIDDAQPENITLAVARERPDISVIKCLARVPGLRCPFDFGLFAEAPSEEKQEVCFTCLAEVVTLAATGHQGHFTVGRPTKERIEEIGSRASSMGIGIAPFHSFREVGEVVAPFLQRTATT